MRPSNINQAYDKTVRILFGVFFFGMHFSCKKYLNPPPLSTFSPEIEFGSVPLARTAVLGAYNDLCGDNGYGIRASMYYPYDSDEMMGAGGNTQDNERRDIARYNVTAVNTQLSQTFNQFYQGIERANLCIYYLPKMPQYVRGSALEQGELRRLFGEALTLRAQYYFELIRNWGDLPEQRLPSALLSNLFLPKIDRDTIYNHILNDLLTAEDLVPWRTEVARLGDALDQRITKGAVKALRARIALFRGGYSLRKNRVMERRSDYKTFYQIAKSECEELMAKPDQHTLNPSYKSVWKDYVCAHNGNDPSGELVFQVAMGGATASTDSKLGTYNGTKYGAYGGGSLSIMPTYLYMFDSTDIRRDVTCVPAETTVRGPDGKLYRKAHAINAIVDGKWRKEWLTNPVYPNSIAANLGLNWVILRFSDVLLMFAEADNEVNGLPSPAAMEALTKVNQRAHGGDPSQVPPVPLDYQGFFKYIVRERMLEFGSEGVRKYDLIRWNLLNVALTETRDNLASLGATPSVALTPPDYMASPPAYCLNELPKTMYYYSFSSGDDLNSLFANSLYNPSPPAAPLDGTVTTAGGKVATQKVNWVGFNGINSSFTSLFAFAFKPNHSELLPLGVATLNANYALTQDYGY